MIALSPMRDLVSTAATGNGRVCWIDTVSDRHGAIARIQLDPIIRHIGGIKAPFAHGHPDRQVVVRSTQQEASAGADLFRP